MKNRNLLDLAPQNLLTQEVAAKDLDDQSIKDLAQTNRQANRLFKPVLAFRHLKNFVERSAKTQVLHMLNNPLRFSFTADQLRYAFDSAFRLGNLDLCKDMMKARANELKQIQLPKLLDETNTYDFTDVLAAIETDKDVEKVLTKMRADLDKIVKEKGFPFQALIDVLKIYDDKFHNNGARLEQLQIIGVKVIGYLQRLSTTWLRKAYANKWSLEGDTFNLMTFLRTAEHIDDPSLEVPFVRSDQSIDPALDIPNAGLGYDICVNWSGKACHMIGHELFLATAGDVEALLKTKMAELEGLCDNTLEQKCEL